jgi:hypothetical protein
MDFAGWRKDSADNKRECCVWNADDDDVSAQFPFTFFPAQTLY